MMHAHSATNTVYTWMQTLVLALMGSFFAANVLNGNITNYVAARFVWLSWVAAALLLSMAALRLWRHVQQMRTPVCGPACEHAHTHAHGPAAWIGLGIIALPVALGLLVPSESLDSRAIDGTISSDLRSLNVAPGQTLSIAPQERTILDWLRAFSAADDPGALTGQRADVIGFVYRDARFDQPEQFMVARFVVSCCVADAQAIGLRVEWADGAALEDNTWVRVEGALSAQTIDGTSTPVINADAVTAVERPAHPYLYP